MDLPAKTMGPDHHDVTESVAASQEFENFIYLVSHDVRNSVRALLELPQWIEDDLISAGYPVPGPVAENIRMLNTHMQRLDRMLIDLLIHSRIGRMQTNREVEWNGVIDTILDQIQLPAGFRVLRDLAVPTIRIGETDVLTLVASLVSNAIKHHDRDKGSIRITTAAERGGQVLTVTDDGPGIPERFRDKVFEVMTTLSPRDEVEGSGMGLANVRKIAALYGARTSWPAVPAGRGCSIALHFPSSRPLVH